MLEGGLDGYGWLQFIHPTLQHWVAPRRISQDSAKINELHLTAPVKLHFLAPLKGRVAYLSLLIQMGKLESIQRFADLFQHWRAAFNSWLGHRLRDLGCSLLGQKLQKYALNLSALGLSHMADRQV